MNHIRYLSDLHLEFIKPKNMEKFINKIPSGIDEICILAGDIGNPYQSNYKTFMEFISKNFKKTFVISGNHEYYNKTKTVEETNDYLISYFSEYDNISYLNNSYELYEGYCFIGTTLWSKITNPKYEINDVYYIPHFDYIQCNIMNILCVDFLEDALINNDNCIVITHHVPSDTLIDVKYKTHDMIPYNQWFYCDMD
jgi:predicted phosphohydrolase